MEKKTVFVANDGKQFLTETECISYENAQDFCRLVDAFLDSPCNPYRGGVHRTMLSNALIAFENYQRDPQGAVNEAMAKTITEQVS